METALAWDTTCNYEEVVWYCGERHSHLIEIFTSEQMEFVVNKLMQLNTDHAILPNSRAHHARRSVG